MPYGESSLLVHMLLKHRSDTQVCSKHCSFGCQLLRLPTESSYSQEVVPVNMNSKCCQFIARNHSPMYKVTALNIGLRPLHPKDYKASSRYLSPLEEIGQDFCSTGYSTPQVRFHSKKRPDSGTCALSSLTAQSTSKYMAEAQQCTLFYCQ